MAQTKSVNLSFKDDRVYNFFLEQIKDTSASSYLVSLISKDMNGFFESGEKVETNQVDDVAPESTKFSFDDVDHESFYQFIKKYNETSEVIRSKHEIVLRDYFVKQKNGFGEHFELIYKRLNEIEEIAKRNGIQIQPKEHTNDDIINKAGRGEKLTQYELTSLDSGVRELLGI